MHLIERYATACGVKIGEPFIYEVFFPVNIEKYISFQPFSKYSSKNYDHWDEVINIIISYLNENGIQLVQIGAKNDKSINHCISFCGQTSISQAAYIVKNSIMHIGADSFSTHIASGYQKKILAIYSNNNINNVKPYWSKEEDMILLKAESSKKPSYSAEEHPKSINSIKPETIAKGILKLLNISHKKLPKTLRIGSNYINKTLEVIPDKPMNPQSINIDNIIIRMDYFFNEEVLSLFLSHKKCIIFTNKPINEDLIKRYKQNIIQVVYIIEKQNDPEFIKILKRNTINAVMVSFLPENELNEFKLNYMDYGLIIKKDHPVNNIKITDKTYFKSSRILLSSEGQYNTKYQWLSKDMSNKFINNDELLKELEELYIFELDE
jgi:hypothetical protein